MDDQNGKNAASIKESKKAGTPNQMLRRARELRGWTQQELADRLGTTPLAINRWEQGKTFPSSFYRTKLCEVFEASTEALGLVRETLLEAIVQEEEPPAQEVPPVAEVPIASSPLLSSSPSPPPPHHPAKEPRKGRILLAGIAVVLLIGIGIGLSIPRLPLSPTPVSGATKQLSLHVTATQASMPTPSGTPVINDSLMTANTQGQWDAGKICMFKEQAYYVRSVGANYCSAQVAPFSDIFYQMEVTIREGQQAGIIFRADGNSDIYYFFVTIDGHYGLELIKQPSTDKLLKSGFSAAIRQGTNQANTQAVYMKGSTIILWVNGQQVGRVEDSTFTEGYVGICVGGYSSDPGQSVLTIATYRNAKVWKLD